MEKKLFGTDGVRGVANIYPMTTEMAMQLGRAAAYVFKDGNRRHRIVIGKDTRLSGYMIENALAAGICSMGVDVLQVGPLPTPGIAFITASRGETTPLSSMKSPSWESSSSPMGVSREIGSLAIFRTFRTLSSGRFILSAISSGEGSLPISCTS